MRSTSLVELLHEEWQAAISIPSAISVHPALVVIKV